MNKLFLAVGILLFGFSTFAQDKDHLLENYMTVKDALVSGDAKATNKAINLFYQTVNKEADLTGSALGKATEKLNRATGMEKQRVAFQDVSTQMWKHIKDSDEVNQTVYYQYCPMKKAHWLSKEKEIKNPYYGSSMLTCGKVVETKQ